MTLKILGRWVLVIVILITTALAYRLIYGPISEIAAVLFQLIIPLSMGPVIFLSLNWNYIKSSHIYKKVESGRIANPSKTGNFCLTKQDIPSLPCSHLIFNINDEPHYTIHMGRWEVYEDESLNLKIYHDRFLRRWYYIKF